MKLGLSLLLFTWLFILIAWFAPGVFKVIGAAFFALGDASESIRGTFSGKYSTYRRKGIQLVEAIEPKADLTPVQKDVLQALIAQGATKTRAKASVDRAIASCPAQASFDELWRKAVAA